MTSIEVKYRGHIDFKLKLYFTNQPYRFQKYPEITKIPANQKVYICTNPKESINQAREKSW